MMEDIDLFNKIASDQAEAFGKLEQQRDDLLEAVRAMYAWFYCEEMGAASTHAARQELCNYTQHLCKKALDMTSGEYVGLPRLYLHGIERADEENCRNLIKEVFEVAQEKATDKATSTQEEA